MSTEPYSELRGRSERTDGFAKRLDEWGWALFLIMTGAIWLVPEQRVPNGVWLIGTGVLLLALNIARYFMGLRIGGFTSVLGVLALAGGVGEFFGMELPLFALALLVLGVSILVKPFLGAKP